MLCFKYLSHKGRQFQSGFTLIELMVALVLGLLVVLGASQLFLTSSQAFRSIDDINRRQEVVSYVSSVIGSEIRAARVAHPIGSDGSSTNESGRLQLEFDAEYDSPYCPSSDDVLVDVEYEVKSSPGDEDLFLFVEAKCEDVVGTEFSVQSPVIGGISSLKFVSNELNKYVDLVVTLEPSGMPPLSDVVTMRFARHSSDLFTDE